MLVGGERCLPDAGGVADFKDFDADKGIALRRLHLFRRKERREEEKVCIMRCEARFSAECKQESRGRGDLVVSWNSCA